MYDIRPESVKTYLEDRKIFFPRFQRRQAWDNKKNFKLCISVFKNFPVGVVVINREEYKNTTMKWLLDGRQRRNALMRMMEDIEEIYEWAKSFIKIRKNDQAQDIEEKFWKAIEEHLERDVDKNRYSDDDSFDEFENEEENLVLQNDDSDEIIEGFTNNEEKDDDLKLLLNIILMVHDKNSTGSGFTRPFDFRECIDNLSYVENTRDGVRLNCKKLRLVLIEFNKRIYEENRDDFTSEDFYNYMIEKFKVSEEKTIALKLMIERKWYRIKERIKAVDSLENKLRDTVIGIIELKNASLIDAQNIFKLINSEGTPLTSEEILSSKPSWNIEIKNPSEEFKEQVNLLYKVLNVKVPSTVVRWDFPATLLGRLEGNEFIIRNLDLNKDNEFKIKITLGFKLVSAIYEEGINKNCVSNIAKNKEIKWKGDLDELVRDLNMMFKIISEIPFFKYFSSWKVSLMELTSDAVVINFITVLYKDWVKKGKPILGSSRKFQKNAIVLFDKLLYEYLMGQWKGSSDSKVARNIKALKQSEDLILSAIDTNKWETLLDEIIDHNKINDITIKRYQDLKPILIYYYCLNNIQGPMEGNASIDHLYSQDKFTSSTIENSHILKDNLTNLYLIYKNGNSKKNVKSLKAIENTWLIENIVRYSEVSKDDFEKYSDLNNFEELRQYRKELFKDTFKHKRDYLLNN